jgi:hypothetical protein
VGRNFNSGDVITINGISTAVDISTGPMTISLWMKPSAIGASEHDLLSKWSGGATSQQYLVTIGSTGIGSAGQAGYVIGSYSAINGVYSVAPPTLTANALYQLIVWVDPAGKFSAGPSAGVKLSGALTGASFVAFRERRTAGGVNLLIGGQVGIAASYAGMIAEVAIWNDILSPGEQLSLQVGVNPNRVRRTALAGYWPLWGNHSPEPDISGNVLNGILSGTSGANHAPVTPPA